jgi:hypothetical protein
VYQVDRQLQVEDRMQRGGRHQITAMQHRLGAQRFRLRDGCGERLAMVVAVGDNADFQTSPPRALYPMQCKVFSMVV